MLLESFDYSTAVGMSNVCIAPQQYETPLYPCGCIFKIRVLSAWGDPFYVGLNGLEFYDHCGNNLELNAENIQVGAYLFHIYLKLHLLQNLR